MSESRNPQMDLSDRIAIETGLLKKSSIKKIARIIHRHPSTVSHEIKENRTYISGTYYCGKDCKWVKVKTVHNLCGDPDCMRNCCRCRKIDCREHCPQYVSIACHKFEKAPYVCNACYAKNSCQKARYIYSAKHADAAASRRRSESRQGIRISEREKEEMDILVSRLVKQGQPLAHICAEHKKEIPICLRTLYNYIDQGRLTVKNIDLRRKTGYRQRKKKAGESIGFANMEFRQSRTYADYEKAVRTGALAEQKTVEMDTVKGVREQGKRLLTMIFRDTNVMLLFLMPDGTAGSVKAVFDYLEISLGLDVFQRLFPVILTDNGSEFKRVDDLELNGDSSYRTHLYYCDPMASWQKGCIEKNHEFIRYVITKGKSLNPYTQEDITLLMNHINSIKRPGLGNKSPYDLVDENDEDFRDLMLLLKMHPIPADEVHLTPDLFRKK